MGYSMADRTFILLSVPSDFIEKITGLINNINLLNNDSTEPPVKIEKVYFKKKPKFAAVPKE
jgi:hypothetical protein